MGPYKPSSQPSPTGSQPVLVPGLRKSWAAVSRWFAGSILVKLVSICIRGPRSDRVR